jgi:hypothetical protein
LAPATNPRQPTFEPAEKPFEESAISASKQDHQHAPTSGESTTPAAPKPTKTIVRVLTSCYDDNGKLRDPGDIFATTRGGALIAGRECSNAETELQAKLDADQQAVEKLKTA